MKYEAKPSFIFLEQLKKLSYKTRQIIKEKIDLAVENPGRFKRIKGFNLFLFRIRFADSSKELRIIYLIDGKYVKLICILDRGNEYKDLKHILQKLGLL